MKRKTKHLIAIILIIVLTISNTVYAQPISKAMEHMSKKQPVAVQGQPIGPKIEELKGKEDIIRNLDEIRRIRANLTILDIRETSTNQQLASVYKNLEMYINQFNVIRNNLERHKVLYKDSFVDILFSEQLILIVDSYILSLRQQENLIIAMEANIMEAKKIFYSSYLIPVYYYLTLGDQMIAYIDTYFVIS